MAWEHRGAQTYYYRSVKRGGRVSKVYMGKGPFVGMLAEEVELRNGRSVKPKPRPGSRPAKTWRPSMPRLAPGGTQEAPSSTPSSSPMGTTDTIAAPGASALDEAQLRKLIDQANKGNTQAFDRLRAMLPTAGGTVDTSQGHGRQRP